MCHEESYIIIDIPHRLPRECWLLKYKICTVNKPLGEFCWKDLQSWLE